MTVDWAPSPEEEVQLSQGEAIVEWSARHGWRVVPLSEIPEEDE